jgi:hypothetical protein
VETEIRDRIKAARAEIYLTSRAAIGTLKGLSSCGAFLARLLPSHADGVARDLFFSATAFFSNSFLGTILKHFEASRLCTVAGAPAGS